MYAIIVEELYGDMLKVKHNIIDSFICFELFLFLSRFILNILNNIRSVFVNTNDVYPDGIIQFFRKSVLNQRCRSKTS